MAMTQPGGAAQVSFCNQLALRFHRSCFGFNPGCWKSCFPFNRLIFILESDGKSSFSDRETSLFLKSGMWILVPAFHEITHEQNSSMLHLSIHFNLELYHGFDLFSHLHSLVSDVNPELCVLARGAAEEGDRLCAAGKQFDLCWRVLSPVLNRVRLPFEELLAGQLRYRPLFDYLAEHCRAGMDVGEMARIMRMNRETFTKKFIYDTGFPPKKLFNRILVEKASRLLCGSGKSIREIAAELHFCNEFYFSRFFRKHLGMTPSAFRKEYGLHPEKCLPRNIAFPAK